MATRRGITAKRPRVTAGDPWERKRLVKPLLCDHHFSKVIYITLIDGLLNVKNLIARESLLKWRGAVEECDCTGAGSVGDVMSPGACLIAPGDDKSVWHYLHPSRREKGNNSSSLTVSLSPSMCVCVCVCVCVL